MSELLDLSENIAREAHTGQLYGDKNYFEAHIVPVVAVVCRLGYGPEYQATAYLHDVQEDSGMTAEDLISKGIPAPIAHSVGLLSKDPAVPHNVYLTRIGQDGRATVAKFGDSAVNFANTALMGAVSSDQKFRERVDKYVGNLAFLKPLLPQPVLEA